MEKENVNPGELVVNQNDMGVVNVQNYVKENQRNQNAEQVMTAVREDVEPIGGEKLHLEPDESVNTAINPERFTEETKTGQTL